MGKLYLRRLALGVSALLFGAATFTQAQTPVTYLDQGWQPRERRAWYSATQGSRLMPAAWLQALEQPDNDSPFLSPDKIEQFRYLRNETSPSSNYPIGFAEDIQPDDSLVRTRLRWFTGQRNQERWVGFTCAACHTADIEYNGRRIRIDGAPAISDFQTFVEEINRSLQATISDDAKFLRFSAEVLRNRNTPVNRIMLRDAMRSLYAWQMQIERANHSPMRYGFARLDAIGHILNRAAIFAGAENPTGNPSDAPVSYPFLWNTPQHDRVQWNGSASNERTSLGFGRYIDLNALGRNSGEVIGVFGEVVPSRVTESAFDGLYSSVFVDNLEKLEKLVAKLESPAWPGPILGAINEQSRARGEALFAGKCASCHHPLDREDLSSRVEAQMSFFQPRPGSQETHRPPGTDPAMACRAAENASASGVLRGLEIKDENGNPRQIGETDNVIALLQVMVRESLLNQKGEIATTIASIVTGLRRSPVVHNPGAPAQWWNRATPGGRRLTQPEVDRSLEEMRLYHAPAQVAARPLLSASPMDWGPFTSCVNGPWSSIKGYKARPLNGIWATAPYLHNGSVASLYELLLPPAERRRFFYTGSRQFDPANVGYITDETPQNSFRFESYDSAGRIIWGNWNGGHDYDNASLTPEMRRDLVEYMKSL